MPIIDILISGVLALIMFGIGSTLSFSDFKTLFKRSKPFITGISLQMLFLPTLALSIAYFSNLPPEWKVGLFIVSICPGGTTSNFISQVVSANLALSIALTSVNSIIILFSIPILSNWSIDFFIADGASYKIGTYTIALHIFLILMLPAFLGVLVNEFLVKSTKRLRTFLKYFNTFLLALVFAVKFFASEESGGSGISFDDIKLLLPVALLLHFGSMLFSYFFAKIIGIRNINATTIGIEVGLQNTTLALLITGTIIGNNEMTKPALVFALFSFFTTLLFAWLSIMFRRNITALFSKIK